MLGRYHEKNMYFAFKLTSNPLHSKSLLKSNIDSIDIFKHKIDSLNRVIGENHLTIFGIRIDEGPIIPAIIISVTTILTVILGFIFKDYWIPKWVENRTDHNIRNGRFIRYKVSLFRAAFSFNQRLHEIYRTRSQYLWDNTVLHAFYDYKYKSSVYRLCVLLAWIRVFRLLEHSITNNKTNKRSLEISKCLSKVESSLADGQSVEMVVVKGVLDILGHDYKKTSAGILEKTAILIDHLVHKYLHMHNVDFIGDLPSEIAVEFLSEMETILKEQNIDTSKFDKNRELIIKEVSVKLALIYRDWQQAIGDLMLVKEEGEYSVISFREFEKLWSESDSHDKKWLKRAELMFKNLDMRVDAKSDSRIGQIKDIYKHIYGLLNLLFSMDTAGSSITKETFKNMHPTIEHGL